MVPPQAPEIDGPTHVLRMARSLFAHSWFDFEFMTVACLLGLQAMETAFRALYPEPEGRPLAKLVNQAERDSILPHNIAELAGPGSSCETFTRTPERSQRSPSAWPPRCWRTDIASSQRFYRR
jgi:hypothetical protein